MYSGVLIDRLSETMGKGNTLQLYRQMSERVCRALGRTPTAHEEVCFALLVHMLLTHLIFFLSIAGSVPSIHLTCPGYK